MIDPVELAKLQDQLEVVKKIVAFLSNHQADMYIVLSQEVQRIVIEIDHIREVRMNEEKELQELVLRRAEINALRRQLEAAKRALEKSKTEMIAFGNLMNWSIEISQSYVDAINQTREVLAEIERIGNELK